MSSTTKEFYNGEKANLLIGR